MINPLMFLHHQNIATFCQNDNMNGAVWDFPYTGAVQTITLGKGTYKLEVWGAQGGSIVPIMEGLEDILMVH